MHLDTAQVVATMLRSRGATVDLKINDVATLLQKRVTGDYMTMMDTCACPGPTLISTTGTSTQPGRPMRPR
ncbi:MAG TPA: hypothetical protein VJT32_16155 [bacterium]|nr:hypothetical protein [bacterium]